MATSRTIQINTQHPGLWSTKQHEAVARKTTELLQIDHEKHHCFFNDHGFHDHISHHLLAIYGLGASVEDIQKAYDDNVGYQRSMMAVHPGRVEELKDWEKAQERLGNEENYHDFLVFFQEEIDRMGWEDVLNDYLFKGDERADDLLSRMFDSLLHPFIQLMYGVEWEQPAIVAMGLAQGAVHSAKLGKFLKTAEKAAKNNNARMPSIAQLLQEVASNKKLASASKITDGILVRAFDEAIEVVSRVHINPEELEERTVEMFNTAVYQAAAAAIRPGKIPKVDFFLMHHLNLCPIFLALNALDWIPEATKIRLLEYKIRLDLLEYAARACPPLSFEAIDSYVPKGDPSQPMTDLLPRIFAMEDDGHVSKLLRSFNLCEEVSKKYEDKSWLKIKGDTWNKVRHLAIEAVESPGPRWVRGAGYAEAWESVPSRL
ncbi:HypA protein [Xylariaceae sp. FL1272]|nr:HypA protein [Xylariaceae sp. FL1272]